LGREVGGGGTGEFLLNRKKERKAGGAICVERRLETAKKIGLSAKKGGLLCDIIEGGGRRKVKDLRRVRSDV